MPMWLKGACDLPFVLWGDIAHCWLPAGHEGDCLEVCRQHLAERIANLTGEATWP